MNRRTYLLRKKIHSLKRNTFILLGLFLLFAGPMACSGSAGPGGASPLGGPGGAGGYGAPPISIPGPEALNMTGVSVTLDGAGNATATGAPGTGHEGYEVRVRNLGNPPVARNNPFKDLFIKKAYAAAGGSCKAIVAAGGSFTCGPIPGSAVNDWLELRQCYTSSPTSACSFPMLIQIGTGVIQPGTSKYLWIGKDGSSWTGSQNKKWRWWNLFMSTAYAAEENPGIGMSGIGGLIPGGMFYGIYDPMRGFTGAACSLAGFSGSVSPARTDKVCKITKTPSGSTRGVEWKVIDDCDPDKMGIFTYEDAGMEKLAVYSQNKLWIYRTDTKDQLAKYSYWANISKVQFFNGVFATAFDLPAGSALPAIAVNHSCVDDPLLRTVNEILDFDSDGTGSYLFSVKDNSNRYFLILGPSTEFLMDDFYKVEQTSQSSPIKDVVLLRGRSCGYTFAALSPDLKQVFTGFYRAPSMARSILCPEEEFVQPPLSIPGAKKPVGLAWDRNNMLVVLDAPGDENAKLHSFLLTQDGYKYSLAYAGSVDLGPVKPNFIRYNLIQRNFVTDARTQGEDLTHIAVTREEGSSTVTFRVNGAVR